MLPRRRRSANPFPAEKRLREIPPGDLGDRASGARVAAYPPFPPPRALPPSPTGRPDRGQGRVITTDWRCCRSVARGGMIDKCFCMPSTCSRWTAMTCSANPIETPQRHVAPLQAKALLVCGSTSTSRGIATSSSAMPATLASKGSSVSALVQRCRSLPLRAVPLGAGLLGHGLEPELLTHHTSKKTRVPASRYSHDARDGGRARPAQQPQHPCLLGIRSPGLMPNRLTRAGFARRTQLD
jgi:hypothetical protein